MEPAKPPAKLLPRVERTVELAVPAEETWRHLIDGSLASLWMGGQMTIEPRRNGSVRLHGAGAPEVFGTVEELINGESITWSWRTRDGEPTQVSITVESSAGGCVLRVTEQMIPYEIVHVDTVFGHR